MKLEPDGVIAVSHRMGHHGLIAVVESDKSRLQAVAVQDQALNFLADRIDDVHEEMVDLRSQRLQYGRVVVGIIMFVHDHLTVDVSHLPIGDHIFELGVYGAEVIEVGFDCCAGDRSFEFVVKIECRFTLRCE